MNKLHRKWREKGKSRKYEERKGIRKKYKNRGKGDKWNEGNTRG